jgi:hypothetical protein
MQATFSVLDPQRRKSIGAAPSLCKLRLSQRQPGNDRNALVAAETPS